MHVRLVGGPRAGELVRGFPGGAATLVVEGPVVDGVRQMGVYVIADDATGVWVGYRPDDGQPHGPRTASRR